MLIPTIHSLEKIMIYMYLYSILNKKQVKSSKETEEACDLDLEGKSNEELTQLSINQVKQIENLEKENNRLRLAIYRIKKNLNTVSTM